MGVTCHRNSTSVKLNPQQLVKRNFGVERRPGGAVTGSAPARSWRGPAPRPVSVSAQPQGPAPRRAERSSPSAGLGAPRAALTPLPGRQRAAGVNNPTSRCGWALFGRFPLGAGRLALVRRCGCSGLFRSAQSRRAVYKLDLLLP